MWCPFEAEKKADQNKMKVTRVKKNSTLTQKTTAQARNQDAVD